MSNIIPLFEVPVEPMDQETSKYFDQCTLLEVRNDPEVNAQIINDLLPDFAYRVLLARLNVVGCQCSPALFVFILSLCDNPAKLVQWSFTLYCIQQMSAVDKVTITKLTEYFPNGFPSDSEYSRLWDQQKQVGQPHNNSIDNFDNWPIALNEAKQRRHTT